MRRGEAAAGDALAAAAHPGDFQVLATRSEFDQVPGLVAKLVWPLEGREVDRDDGGEMAGPFAAQEVLVVAGGDQVAAFDVGLVYPVFVVEHLIFTAATKTAVENMIAALQRQARAFA